MIIQTTSGSKFCLKRTGNDKVAARLPNIQKFVEWANQEFFGLSSQITLHWTKHPIFAAEYMPVFEEGEDGEIIHTIGISKIYAKTLGYLVGTVLHELIHAKQLECTPLEYFNFQEDKGAIHNAYFWRNVHDVSRLFSVPIGAIANPLIDND